MKTARSFTTSIEVTLTEVNPAVLWMMFGPHAVRADLLHDACWDGEAIR